MDRVVKDSDRPTPVLRSLQSLFSHGRLDGTGYVSILPVDQGIEHSAGASFAKNPDYFDPEGIVKLAIEGGCNAVASTLGVLGACARKYAHHIPFIVKLNHNDFLSYPNAYDQIMFGQVRQARAGRGGRRRDHLLRLRPSQAPDRRGLEAFAVAHEHGLATILWCYLRNSAFNRTKDGGLDYHGHGLDGQANPSASRSRRTSSSRSCRGRGARLPRSRLGKTDKRVYSG